MKSTPFLVLLFSIAVGFGSVSRHAAAEPPLQFVEHVLNAKPDDELPLLIVVHGLGDTPERFQELFVGLNVPVRIIAPRAPDPHTEGGSWFPIDDKKLAPGGILKRAQLLTDLADQLRKKRKTRGLPIITGFSQGGILSYAIAAFHADHFASAVPIAGRLYDPMPPYQKAPPSFRVVAFHGEADQRVTYQGDLQTVERLKKVGTNVTLTGLPGLGHILPTSLVEQWYATLREEIARR